MIYFTVSNLSHIHHYLRFCELKKEEVMPFTLSKDVINFFKRHKIKTIIPRSIKINSKLQKSDLNKIVNYLNNKINLSDQFIFIDRLMNNEILYIVSKISKSVNVLNYEDYEVTKSYKKFKLYQYTLRDLFNLIKYNFLLGMKFQYFWSHDQKCLGVDTNTLKFWGVKVIKQFANRKDYIFDHKAKWIFKYKSKNKQNKKKSRIIFPLGISINEQCTFYDISLRKKIIDLLINKFKNRFKIKYSPRATKFEFNNSYLIDNKLMLEEICNDSDIIISDYSTSLITCANKGLKTISILNMTKVIDKKMFNFWKKWLTKHQSEYPVFPNTYEELIINIKKQI